MKTQGEFDVVVVGGGPAGMMSAGRAAERGLRVLLIEKNDSLGKKLLITGGGRCNVTNAEMDTRTLLQNYKDKDKFLFSAFSQHGVADTLNFFHERGMDTKEEARKRVFPASNTSLSVWNTLVHYMQKGNVMVLSDSPVTAISHDESKITSITIRGGRKITADSFILATGGKSRPETGSTGDGFAWLRDLKHTVHEPEASLVPVEIEDSWVHKLQGVSLPEVKITLLQNSQRQNVSRGRILFTHFGITGPTILNMSKDIGELLKYGSVTISLDTLPALDHGMVNTRLQDVFKAEGNKKFKNSLGSLIPSALAPIIVEKSGINADAQCNKISRDHRLRLIDVLKNLTMEVRGLLGVEKAIITSGGVDVREIDFKTMASRKYPNLYIIGDLLHIDRPSGGYSLQLCWTTGFVAGDSVCSNP